MKFPYTKLPSYNPNLKWISRPYILVKIIGPKRYWEGYGLIDSGADRCLFNIKIATDIGLNLDEGVNENFAGIEGGSLKATLQNVSLQITGMNQEITVTAGFVNSPGVTVILGQEGFFDNFRIKFEKDRGIIELNLIK